MRIIGGLLITTGLAIVGTMQVWDDLVNVAPSIARYKLLIILFAISLIALGVFLCSTHWIKDKWRKLAKRFFGEWTYDCRNARPADAKWIDDLSTAEIGSITSDFQAIRRLIEKPEALVIIVYRMRGSEGQQTVQRRGYFIVFPLSEEGVRKLRAETFNAKNPDDADLCKRGVCRAAYIGGIAAKAGACRGHTNSMMLAHLRSAEFRRATELYARAGTERGLQLLTARNFAPVNPAKSGLDGLFVRSYG